jgi:hypothetical protein
MALPLLAGAVKLTLAPVAPDLVADTLVGVPGTVVGVILLLAELDAPAPTLLVADTVNVYAVPAVNPVTNIGLVVPVFERPPGELVAVYLVIVAPPLLAGAVNATLAVVLLVTAAAVPIVGAPGTMTCVTVLLILLGRLASKTLLARTVNV